MQGDQHRWAAFAAWERDAWEERAGSYADAVGALTRGSVPALLDAAGVTAGVRVLDVGTGPGYVALGAQQRGAAVVAADQSPAMVAIARAAGVEAVVAPVEELPFADGTFDAVVGGCLLHHLPAPDAAVAELARVLRPGGRVALSVWDLPEANPALGLFGPLAAALGVGPPPVPPGPDAGRFAHDEAMAGLLEGCLREVVVTRATWTLTVEPGSWFDAVASSMPRTGAVLAAADAGQRRELRARYVEVARERYGVQGGQVALPASAVIGAGSR